MTIKEDYLGKTYGKLKIIGDTGKRDKHRNKILIARHLETGEYFESSAKLFREGATTGFKSGKSNRINGSKNYKYIEKARKDKKIEKRRTLNANVEQYKSQKGVSFQKASNKWRAYITPEGKQKHLGLFNTEQEAIAARQKAVNEQIKILKQEMERL